MWDNAPLLRNIANTLFFLSALAVFYGGMHYLVHMPGLLPVKVVRLSNAPERVVADDVQSMLRAQVHGNFFTVDIDQLRGMLEKLPWVRNVSIRREFPDKLLVSFEEHKAVAHWNDIALVNQQGEVFEAESTVVLPDFFGTEGTSPEVLKQFENFSGQLAPLHLGVMQLVLSTRHAWQLHLSNNIVVELGREAMQQRLARFIAVYPYIMAQPTARDIQVVDMRYRDGFAVRLRPA